MVLNASIMPRGAHAADQPHTPTQPATAASTGQAPASLPSEHGMFVAVGYGGRRISSPDGQHWENNQRWSDVAADNDDVLFNIAFGNGRFIAVGGGAKIGHLLSTRDGRQWSELPSVHGRVATVVFGNGRFIAGHDPNSSFPPMGRNLNPVRSCPGRVPSHARRSAFGDGEGGARCVIIGDIDLWGEKKRVSWRAATENGKDLYFPRAGHAPGARRGLRRGAVRRRGAGRTH